MKNVMATITKDVHDLMPELVLFTAELFHVLYLVVCLQSVGDVKASVAVIALDALNQLASLRGLDAQATKLQRTIEQACIVLPNSKRSVKLQDLVPLVQHLCSTRHCTLAEIESFHVRLRTTPAYRLPLDDTALFARLDTLPASSERPPTLTKRTLTSISLKQLAVHPTTNETSGQAPSIDTSSLRSISPGPPPALATHAQPESVRSYSAWFASTKRVQPEQSPGVHPLKPDTMAPTLVEGLTLEQKRLVVQQSLQMLFRCEYLVLIEYIECAMPLIYATYTAVLYHSLNARFFARTRDMSGDELASTLATIALYTLVEGVSLLVLHVILKHRFGLSALHQLAFVLETQGGLIQSKMLVWAPVILQYEMDHCGMDFTFKFDYSHTRNATQGP